jgi:hypothetical protein
MSWNFVSSRRLQAGHRYGVWVTTTGVTSSDEIARWLRSKRWTDVTLLQRATLPTGQMVKELHAIWDGADGAVLPTSDSHVGYGPLYISDSRLSDPGDVPSRAPGERPPPPPELLEQMRQAQNVTVPNKWKMPALLVAGAGLFLLLRNKPDPAPPDFSDDEGDGDATR